MFLSAPKLFDVDLSGYNFSAMILPWEQLRRFKTQFLTVAECLKVLRRSPNLKECHLESIYSPEIFASPTPETLYFQLEYLDVTLLKGAAISLLDSLTLPDLHDLRIHYNGPGGFPLSAISSLVVRSSCNLTRLCIEKQNIQEIDLINCLESISSLADLRVIEVGDVNHPSSGLTDGLIGMLHPSYASGKPLLPKLIVFEYRGRVSCDSRKIFEVLQERWRPSSYETSTSRLKIVEIISLSPYEVADDIQADVKRLREEGMHVDLRYLDDTQP